MYTVIGKVFCVIFLQLKNSIVEKYNSLIDKQPEVRNYSDDPNWFPGKFIIISKLVFEIIQQLKIDQSQIIMRNHSIDNQRFTITSFLEMNTKTSLDESLTEQNLDKIILS